MQFFRKKNVVKGLGNAIASLMREKNKDLKVDEKR
jgi:hypothetical protein